MNTVAYLLIVLGAFMLRSASKGRTFTDGMSDIGDMLIAAISNDDAALAEVMSRQGTVVQVDSSTAPQIDTSEVDRGSLKTDIADSQTGGDAMRSDSGIRVLAEMKRLGRGAVYVYGAAGPTGQFDCSGLVWRAMVNTGVYKGPRFTTHTYVTSLGKATRQIGSPVVGCVVLWLEHMGVCDGPGTYYSAVGKNYGIKTLPIGTNNGQRPTFWELV